MQQKNYTRDYSGLVTGGISKGFYLGSYIGSTVIIITIVIIGMFWSLNITSNNSLTGDVTQNTGAILLYSLVLTAASFFYLAIFCLLIYRSWQAIQDGYQFTTPGKAVGFLFIPFFNFYWIFKAFGGLAKGYNDYIDRHQLVLKKLPEGLFTTSCVLNICNILPFIGYVTSLANIIIIGFLVNKLCDGVNALKRLPVDYTALSKKGCVSVLNNGGQNNEFVENNNNIEPAGSSQARPIGLPSTVAFKFGGPRLLLSEDKKIMLDDNVKIIGRGDFTEMVKPDILCHISRNHLLIKYGGGKYSVEDLNSTNGTRCNGRPITRIMELSDGDQILLANKIALIFRQN